MNSAIPYRYLDWDSKFFGRRIAKAEAFSLEASELAQILQWCSIEHIECLYFLIDAHSDPQLLEDNGFHLVDIRLTLEKQLKYDSVENPEAIASDIRASHPEDIRALRVIARVNYADSRFYHDPHFPREQCDLLYETWIESSCQGYADRVFVASQNEQAVGFITCHLSESSTGQIGLLGVHPEMQKQGIGKRLVTAALHYFAQAGKEHVTVVTQGRNIAGQRLYQRCGFTTATVQLWYHGWFV